MRSLPTTQVQRKFKHYARKQPSTDPNLWFNNVEIIASVEIGRETVQYVSNIYKYYLAHKMVTERQAESARIEQKIEVKKSPSLSGDNRTVNLCRFRLMITKARVSTRCYTQVSGDPRADPRHPPA